jgi:hypothetical protein
MGKIHEPTANNNIPPKKGENMGKKSPLHQPGLSIRQGLPSHHLL